MSKYNNNPSNKSHRAPKKYTARTSRIAEYTTLTTYNYWIPKQYTKAVALTINLFKQGISFNKSVDQACHSYPNINRNKLAEHTLKYIANDY